MPQAWEREQMGFAGLEQDVKAIWDFVRNEISNQRTWVLNTIQGLERRMADYTQAAKDAEDALDGLTTKVVDLSTQLQNAIASNDMTAVQAVADQLEQHAQAAKDALNASAPAPADPAQPADPATPADPAAPAPDPVQPAPAGADDSAPSA